jgi:hypothetical protein
VIWHKVLASNTSAKFLNYIAAVEQGPSAYLEGKYHILYISSPLIVDTYSPLVGLLLVICGIFRKFVNSELKTIVLSTPPQPF